MSNTENVVVPIDILKKADDFIRVGTRGVTATSATSVRTGVELLLENNLDIAPGSKILPGQVIIIFLTRHLLCVIDDIFCMEG